MKKRFSLSLILFTLSFLLGCAGKYGYQKDHPDFLIGDWYGTYTSQNTNLVSLKLRYSGSYEYSELSSDSSLIRWENGDWVFQYLQRERVNEVDFSLQYDLVLDVRESSQQEEEGIRQYREFDYFEDGELWIYINKNDTLKLQKL